MLPKKIYLNNSDIESLYAPINKFAQTSSVASFKESALITDGNNTNFDLEAEIKDHPSSLFVTCFAIKADEMNDNGDYFSKLELKKATKTFIGVPVFTNHQNTDINEAKGKVIHSWWDESKNGIMIIARVDAEAYPQLARGIKEQYVTSTSMGASRGHDLVSMADNSRKRVDEICVGDKVFTHNGNIEKVAAIVKTQEHSELYNIQWNGNKKSLALSYEHPVLILKKEEFSNKSQETKPVFVPASEIKPEDYVLELIKNKKQNTEISDQSFLFQSYIAHKIDDVTIISNSEPTYYMQIGELEDKTSDHSYILNDIATHNCQVKYSLCSVCHNLAETPDQYCSCIKERKTRTANTAKQKCQYFKHGTEQSCPICSSNKDNIKTFAYEGKVFEHNYGIKFIENSFVVNPACHSCGVTEIIDAQSFLNKVAEISKRLPRLIKSSSLVAKKYLPIIKEENISENDFVQKICQINEKIPQLIQLKEDNSSALFDLDLFFTKTNNVEKKLPPLLATIEQNYQICDETKCVKIAGQKEIGELNQALDLMTSVCQSMLKQKEQLDLEFLSDLVAVVADLQTTVDELTEQGYGRLQSPTESTQDSSNQTTTQQPTSNQQPMTPVNPTPGGGSKVQSGSAGAVGTVTSPTANQKILNLEKLSKNMFTNKYSKIVNEIAEKTRDKLISLEFKIKQNTPLNLVFRTANSQKNKGN